MGTRGDKQKRQSVLATTRRYLWVAATLRSRRSRGVFSSPTLQTAGQTGGAVSEAPNTMPKQVMKHTKNKKPAPGLLLCTPDW